MRFEVEQKHPVTDPQGVELALAGMGAQPGATIEQVDRYLAHPARDFALTDEALRLRCAGGRVLVTYKGPKVDRSTKTRREIELPLGEAGDVDAFLELFEALGFAAVAEVRKTRRTFHTTVGGVAVEVALDDVAGLGTFVEVEAGAAEGPELEHARQAVAEVARGLGLGEAERRSYLELLLQALI